MSLRKEKRRRNKDVIFENDNSHEDEESDTEKFIQELSNIRSIIQISSRPKFWNRTQF